MHKRKLKERLFVSISTASALLTASLLILILGAIFIKGSSSLTPAYVFTTENDARGFNEGIANAIVGTLILATGSVACCAFSIALAVYLAEYAKRGSKFTSILRFMLDLLSGMPSIVIGMIGFILLVISLKFFTGGFSLIAGTLALSILIVPTMARAAEESLKNVPRNMKEASYALGSTKWGMIKGVSLPYALPGIITGIVLGIGRAAEESAVVVLTAGYTQFMPRFGLVAAPGKGIFMDTKIVPFQEGIASLPIAVYHSVEFSNKVPIENGFATATVLIIIVMLINLAAKTVSWKYGMKRC